MEDQNDSMYSIGSRGLQHAVPGSGSGGRKDGPIRG